MPRLKAAQIARSVCRVTSRPRFFFFFCYQPCKLSNGDGETDTENEGVWSLSFDLGLCQLFMAKVHIYLFKDPT